MIKFENTEVMGWEHAIRGMRNPLESWEKSDSDWDYDCFEYDFAEYRTKDEFEVGPNDLDLMMRLRNAGTDHRKFMRMIAVYVDITAPLYWWKEFDTYKVGTVANSCSTMHTIHKKEFTLDDFSCEHLMGESHSLLEDIIVDLNECRKWYMDTKDKQYWWQMIQLLPTSYNQKRTVMLNYEVLTNMYKSRKDHKLDEWHEFCCWIQHLPYSELIVGHKKLPSTEELDELFEEVKKVDGRIAFRSLTKIDNMQKLDFYDADGKILYSVDLNRNSLVEIFDWIKKSCWHMAKQTLQFGA